MKSYSFSYLTMHLIRMIKKAWPFELGKDLPNHLGAFATKKGMLKPVWWEIQSGLRMRLNIQELIHETIMMEGLWDPELTEFITTHLKPGNVFVDVGAHSGYFTLLAAKTVGESGKVLAIEPNPIIATQLFENVNASNLFNVASEQQACSDSNKEAVLYVHDDSNSSMSSLSGKNVQDVNGVPVTCTTLDALVQKHNLERVHLIKIDVEGAELSVLKGASRTIEQMKPTIVLELDPVLLNGFGSTMEGVVSLLAGFGYSVTPLGGHSNYVCRPRLRNAGES